MHKTKFILSLLFVLAAKLTFAQKIVVGVKAGVQSTAFRIKSKEDGNKTVLEASGIGAVAGATASYSFSPKWSIQPNLLFTLKNGGILTNEGNTQQITVDLPLNVLYRHEGFFIGGGPNFSYGLSAKGIPYDSNDPKENFYSETNNGLRLKRFEMGINSLMGYEFPGGINVSANFTTGLSNILNLENESAKITTRMFGISIGYTFNKR